MVELASIATSAGCRAVTRSFRALLVLDGVLARLRGDGGVLDGKLLSAATAARPPGAMTAASLHGSGGAAGVTGASCEHRRRLDRNVAALHDDSQHSDVRFMKLLRAFQELDGQIAISKRLTGFYKPSLHSLDLVPPQLHRVASPGDGSQCRAFVSGTPPLAETLAAALFMFLRELLTGLHGDSCLETSRRAVVASVLHSMTMITCYQAQNCRGRLLSISVTKTTGGLPFRPVRISRALQLSPSSRFPHHIKLPIARQLRVCCRRVRSISLICAETTGTRKAASLVLERSVEGHSERHSERHKYIAACFCHRPVRFFIIPVELQGWRIPNRSNAAYVNNIHRELGERALRESSLW